MGVRLQNTLAGPAVRLAVRKDEPRAGEAERPKGTKWGKRGGIRPSKGQVGAGRRQRSVWAGGRHSRPIIIIARHNSVGLSTSPGTNWAIEPSEGAGRKGEEKDGGDRGEGRGGTEGGLPAFKRKGKKEV